ncbi:MAG: S8 family serine peptidase [Candidatus Lernaella stagnicola]|nr:S8 family serine peptidase [Candidatus Lernaella stagnicola]
MLRRLTVILVVAAFCLPTVAGATRYEATTTIDGHLAAADSVIVEMNPDLTFATFEKRLRDARYAVRLASLDDGTIVEATDFKAIDLYDGEDVFIAVVDVAADLDLEKQIAELESMPGVQSVWPNYIHAPLFRPNDPYYNQYQGNFRQLFLEDAWDITTGGGATVGVIDSGYRRSGLEDAAENTSGGYDFWGNDTNWNDYIGHGTHVSNTVAEATNNRKGCAGIAFDARLMPLKVFPDYDGGALESDIISAINYARTNGADVINMSLGGGGYVSSTDSAIDRAFNAGVVVVAASGNDGVSRVDYPGAYDNSIAVGSCNTHAPGANPQRSSFSSYGSALDLVAPGDGIVQETYEPGYGVDYYSLGGTSMASPHVAGVAALLVAHGGAHPQGIRQSMYDTARSSSSSWTNQLGWGEVDAYAALVDYAGAALNKPPVAEGNASPTGGRAPLTVTFRGGNSSDPDGTIEAYRWKIINNGNVIGNSKVTTHTFPNPGTYKVELLVTDNRNATDTDLLTINVTSSTGGDDDDADDDAADDDDTFDDSECGQLLNMVYGGCNYALAFENGQSIQPATAMQMCEESADSEGWLCLQQCYNDSDSCGYWRGCARQVCGIRVLQDNGADDSGNGDENDFMWGCGE